MGTTEYAPPDPFHVLERRHALAEIIERGAGVSAELDRIIAPHPEREIISLSENTSRHGNIYAQQCLVFFEAI